MRRSSTHWGQLPMRKLLGLLMIAAIIGGGCAKGHDSGPDRNPRAPLADSTNVETTPTDTLTPYQTVDDATIPCRAGTPPTKEAVIGLLVRVSMHAPLAHLTGPALEIEKQWLRLESEGWPEEAGTWVGDVWFAVDIADGGNQTHLVQLQHGVVGVESRKYTRFSITCNSGHLQVKQQARGLDGPWMEPANELPGQRGDLTPSVVAGLLKAAQGASGPWFAQVATGNALGWQRVDEIYRARGLKPLPDPWKGAAQDAIVNRLDDTHAEVRFPTGTLAIRFERVDGLWKISEYTEGGKWVGAPRDVRLSESGLVFDPPFGVLVGSTDQKRIDLAFGPPDTVKAIDRGKVYFYNLRSIEVTFDANGKVRSISSKTGAPNSGVRVGSPTAQWELIYGPLVEPKKTATEHLKATVQDGKVVSFSATHGPR
jgi:hypothetical protein